MKKIKNTLCGIGEIPLEVTNGCLALVYCIASLLLIYYIILDSCGRFDLVELIKMRMSMEYLFASAMLCPTLGLIADLVLKKL